VTIEKLISALKAAYAKASLNCGDGLLAPTSEEAIRQLELHLEIPIPVELKAVLRVHGGQDYIAPGITGLFGEHKLHSPQEIIEHYKMYSDNCLPILQIGVTGILG